MSTVSIAPHPQNDPPTTPPAQSQPASPVVSPTLTPTSAEAAMRGIFNRLTLAGNAISSSSRAIANSAASMITAGVPSGLESATDAGVSVANFLSSTAAATTNTLSDSAYWFLSGVVDGTVSLSETTSIYVGEKFADLLTGAGQIVFQAGGGVTYAIDTLAGDPSASQSIHAKGLRIAVGLLPVIGSAKDIGAARVKYQKAMRMCEGTEKDVLLHEARRDCLIATTLLSLDVGTLGTTGRIDQILKVGGTLMSALNMTKSVRETTAESSWLPKINLDILTPQADVALNYPPLREAMEIILKANSNTQSNITPPLLPNG